MSQTVVSIVESMAKDKDGLHIQTEEEFQAQLAHLLEHGDQSGDADLHGDEEEAK